MSTTDYVIESIDNDPLTLLYRYSAENDSLTWAGEDCVRNLYVSHVWRNGTKLDTFIGDVYATRSYLDTLRRMSSTLPAVGMTIGEVYSILNGPNGRAIAYTRHATVNEVWDNAADCARNVAL